MTSLEYRKKRIDEMSKKWNLKKVNNFYTCWKIPKKTYHDLKHSLKLYISKALHFTYTDDDKSFINSVDENRENRINVTPNGAVVPKSEYAIEYNLFIRSWCSTVNEMISPDPSILKLFRLTPNVRIKFGNELEDNIGRGLDTAIPHSDAWVEGPWGMNCHLPILGDTENNFLHFHKLKDEKTFQDNFLETSSEYKDMHWVLDHYEDDDIIPLEGNINISDYVLIHNTKRNKNAGTRISIDTTIFSGDHEVHPDRRSEYFDSIPSIGQNLFIGCNVSEKHGHTSKNTTFSHYTTGNLRHIEL